jgi:putative transcriptional regulator
VERVINRIRELRTGRGLTQEALGQSVGVSRQTIISIENGRYVPSLPLALKIAQFFDLATDTIFRLES